LAIDAPHFPQQPAGFWCQEDTPRAAIRRVSVTLDPAARLQSVDQTAEGRFSYIENSRELNLRHPVLSRQERNHPPLRASHTERFHQLIERGPAHSRDVVNQISKTQVACIAALGVRVACVFADGIRSRCLAHLAIRSCCIS